METKKMVLAAILTAISVVIDTAFKVIIPTQLVGVPFYAIPIIIGAIILGTKYSVIIAVLGDIVSAVISPGVTPLPLFTFAALFWGLIPGLFLYRNKYNGFVTGLIVLGTHLIVTSLNSFALYVHFHRSLSGLLVDLPLRLLLIIPNTIIITALTRVVIESLKEVIEERYYLVRN
ncbi:MAG TPA: folate family ECF transporter S component [Acholeplasmataceae bacterium]|nr:folate family ECF transporter S component [Acholeplasmataceae bacterium]